MAKQLNVNLAFTADTGAARQQLQSLQTQLSQLANTPVTLKNGSLTQDIINASNAAAELKIHLEQATNVHTGNLDFSKLNQSIKSSGSSLAEYGEKLKSLGPAGNTAFQALAQSVAKAEIPIRRSNAALTNMWTTLKNTARWQMSSSMLHGFMGAVQSAFGYAQDLNESLNNIRIVTGQNIDQMARFAEQANKAAKALSTTTTEYTNASLIYYQQGLSDSEVAARTEVTVKMANAAGQSAQVVSDQLTAVWNNFAKGGENLEYYADVMTALGAATASSTDEISEGLNKFASVAETVGLSYEYAASALATVTATTRQSADVVGTAFKTLFARIQDLELGKTLDDGTTLGTYSQALQKVGVNIKDANGEMKNMDIILSEMAAKWTTLNKDQQVALAQSVAGVRQYTQLIALMDNWDFMEQNLETSYGATGTLSEQAEIYAESWEAAQKRVSAAAESIYSDLLNDEFFIDVLNGFEKFLTLVDRVIDSMGGLQGVLAGVSAVMLKIFNSQISQSLTNMAYSVQMMTKSGRQKIQDEQTSFIQNAATSLNPDESATVEGSARQASLRSQLQLQVDMMNNAEKMSVHEMEVNQMLMDRVRLIGEEVALKAKAVDLAKEELASASMDARVDAVRAAQTEAGSDNQVEVGKQASADYTRAAGQLKKEILYEDNINNQLNKIRQSGEVTQQSLSNVKAALQQLNRLSGGTLDEFIADLDKMQKELGEGSVSAEDFEKQLRDISNAVRTAVGMSGERKMSDIGVSDENIGRVVNGYKEEIRARREKNQVVADEAKVIDDLKSRIINAQGVQKSWADSVVASAQSISSLSMGISSLGSVVNTIQNPDMSAWEKFTSILMSLGMGIPMLISGLTGLNTTLGFTSAAQALATLRSQDYINAHKASIATLTQETLAEHTAALAKEAHISKKQAEAILIRASTAAKLEELAATGANITAMTAEQLAEKTGMTTDQASIIISKMKAGATLQEAMTEAGLTGTKMGGVAASVASFVAKQAEAGATWAQVVANIALKTSMAPLLVITLLLVAAMAAIAAIIWIVVSAVQSITAAYNADAIAAENAADAAKNLAAAYKEVKSEYDDMISAMDNYQTARDGLDSLTEGTLEYQEALQKANEYALELIEAGNLIKGQDYTIENGEIIISDEAMQSAKEKKFNEVQDAYAASTMANAKAAQAQAKSNQTDLIRKNDSNAVGNVTAAGAIAGAAIGSFIPGIGTAIGALGGAVIGAIGGAIYNGVDNSIENGKIDELTALYDQIGEAAFDSATLQELGFDTANQAYIDSVKDVVRETNAAAEQMEVAAELAASAVLEKNEAYQNSEYQDKIAGAAGKGYQAEYEKAYEEAIKQTKNNDWFGVGSKENKAAMEEYAKQMGLDDLNGFKVTNYKKGGNVEYEYIDENGQKQTVELTQQQIAAQLASTKAAEELAKQTQTLLNTFNRLEDSANKADQALADFASGELANASKSEFEGMESELEGSITTDENGNRVLSDQGALDYINANFSTEELEAMGYASAEEAAAAFKKQFDANLKAWDSIELPENLIGTGNMSLKTVQAFENTVKDLNLGPAGEEAGAQYVEGINKMIEGLSEEDQTKALEQLATIDWSDWDALEQADAIMKQFGVDIDTTTEEWVEYANKMRIAASATPDFTQLRDTLISINGILQDLDFGSIINEEDYQKLIAYNDEWERFFMLQADGSRKFIGDAQNMQQQTRANIIEQRKELQARKDAAEGFQNAKWGHEENGQFVEADWSNKSGSDTATAASLMKAGGATETLLTQMGYTDNVISDMITKATSGQKDLVAEGEAQLRELYRRLGEVSAEELTEMDAQFDEMMASTATNVQDLQNLLNTDQISEEAYDKQLTVLANSASSLSELQGIRDMGTIEGESGEMIGLDTYEYGQALLGLAENYSNCAEEAERYSRALLSGDEATIKAAQETLELSVEIGEMAEKYDLNADSIENFAERLAENNEELKDGKKLTTQQKKAYVDMAVASQRLDRGVKNINDNLDDYRKILKSSNKDTAEFSETMDEFKDNLADVFNVADGDMFSDTFASAMLESEDFARALDGDIEALNRLRADATIDIGDNIITNLGDAADTVYYKFDEAGNKIASSAYTAADSWANVRSVLEGGFEIGDLNNVEFITSLNDMIRASGMTKDEVQSLLGSMGVSAKVNTSYELMDTEVPTYYERSVPDGVDTFKGTDMDGKEITVTRPRIKKMTIPGPPEVVQGHVPVHSIETTSGDTSSGGEITTFTEAKPSKISSGSTTSGSKGGGGGGGGSSPKPKKAETKKKSDVVDRYKEIDDRIDDIANKMDKASRAADRLWGPARLSQMAKVNAVLEDEIHALEKKRKEAENYLKLDKQALKNAISSEANIKISNDDFDANGNFTAYDEVLTNLYNQLDSAITSANADGNADEDEQEKIDKIQERIDKVKDAIDQYDETRELMEDLDNDIQDKIYEWQDNNYELLNYKLEFEIEINDSELELIEYYLDSIKDNVYQAAEAFGHMKGIVDTYNDSIAHQDSYVQQLRNAYAAGEISMDAYKEGLRESQSAMIEYLQALEEQKEAMQDYYGEVMDMAIEEISIFTDEMEELNSVLDHYSNILEITGKQEDYATKNKVLNAKATNLRNEISVQTELYEKSSAEAEKWAEKMANAVVGSNEYETFKKNWIAAQEAANEAQDNMLSKTEEWAEAMKEIIQNELAEAANSMEKSLTGGTTFDELLTSMEHRSSLQEEYLTTTNQIYETNKLMRKAQQEIDKSTNSIAKNKLKNFVKETNELQNQSKLSKYELEIQQAKYDLLLAEIALEDAQRSKTKVRLERDSEGNFSYIYTADQDAIADAQQKVEDMQNSLYNIGLEGANNYAQKYAELMSEAQDEITELTEMWMNGEIATEEEYQRRKAEIQDYYYEQLKNYSNLYKVALTTDTRVIKDAWSTDYGEMTKKTEEWKNSTNTYFEVSSDAFKKWQDVCRQALENSNLGKIEDAVQKVTDKSQDLKEMLIGKGGVVQALMSEATEAGRVSEAYIKIQNQIDINIAKYKQWLAVLNAEYKAPVTPTFADLPEQQQTTTNVINEPEIEDTPIEEPTTPSVKPYQTGYLTWTGSGSSRVWTDSSGNSYRYGSTEQKAIQAAFNKAYGANGGYKGDYFLGWNTLNADVLHEKYGLATGGYTGDWEGSYGKLAFLHQKELVLNAQDTENLLLGMELLDKIVSTIDLYSLNSQLGNMLSTPALGNLDNNNTLEQQVHIEASFPNVVNHTEIEEAFGNLINIASQYANRK